MSDSDRKQGAAVELGLAGKTARAFIHSPLSPLLFLAMLAMGILGLMATPRQEDPQISVPMVDLIVQYPGAEPEQVASLAVAARTICCRPGSGDFDANLVGNGLELIPVENLDLSAWRVENAFAFHPGHLPTDRLLAEAQQVGNVGP